MTKLESEQDGPTIETITHVRCVGCKWLLVFPDIYSQANYCDRESIRKQVFDIMRTPVWCPKYPKQLRGH